MNRHAMFVDVARFQINFVAAYPATIGVFDLGLLYFAPSLDIGLERLVNVLPVVHDCLRTRFESPLPMQLKHELTEAIKFPQLFDGPSNPCAGTLSRLRREESVAALKTPVIPHEFTRDRLKRANR
jgi:hypothetical protein